MMIADVSLSRSNRLNPRAAPSAPVSAPSGRHLPSWEKLMVDLVNFLVFENPRWWGPETGGANNHFAIFCFPVSSIVALHLILLQSTQGQKSTNFKKILVYTYIFFNAKLVAVTFSGVFLRPQEPDTDDEVVQEALEAIDRSKATTRNDESSSRPGGGTCRGGSRTGRKQKPKRWKNECWGLDTPAFCMSLWRISNSYCENLLVFSYLVRASLRHAQIKNLCNRWFRTWRPVWWRASHPYYIFFRVFFEKMRAHKKKYQYNPHIFFSKNKSMKTHGGLAKCAQMHFKQQIILKLASTEPGSTDFGKLQGQQSSKTSPAPTWSCRWVKHYIYPKEQTFVAVPAFLRESMPLITRKISIFRFISN